MIASQSFLLLVLATMAAVVSSTETVFIRPDSNNDATTIASDAWQDNNATAVLEEDLGEDDDDMVVDFDIEELPYSARRLVGRHRRLAKADMSTMMAGCHTYGLLPGFAGPNVPNSFALVDYGCWCGTKGRLIDGPCNTGRVVDQTDNCCRAKSISYGNGPPGCDCFSQSYNWACNIRRTNPMRFRSACEANSDPCAKHCCAADRRFAVCITRARTTMRPAVYWDFSDPTPDGCAACMNPDIPSEPSGPPSHGDCGGAPCCQDCLCCGPGTVWNGASCILAGDDEQADCSEYDVPDTCVTPACVAEGCCAHGTKLVPYPFDESGSTCVCFPEFGPEQQQEAP